MWWGETTGVGCGGETTGERSDAQMTATVLPIYLSATDQG